MGYFPNMTAWEFWATENCFKCAHWPKDEDAPACPVETAHNLYNYEQGEEGPLHTVLELLIPTEGIENKQCAMFRHKHGLSEKHLRDWAKYKAVMAEMEAAQ